MLAFAAACGAVRNITFNDDRANWDLVTEGSFGGNSPLDPSKIGFDFGAHGVPESFMSGFTLYGAAGFYYPFKGTHCPTFLP